ncbi:TetR/AcrR family transcriptional regulator [Clostridium oryzae]|uniref:Putative HTH-type transcriptional regulator YvdT n=1 Tax=Clostridium oryzae TaxID=1450648 RepID=A0A1V4I723_9CLOT|nr:TetR/AcrR family transcriptional regulator [Clostridium oryzae]OPJ55753.1 putative HTH-type transcriptional regulator YvdT [Clostridium oryzae]
MARKASEGREEEILQAAVKIFSEKGYSNTTTSEIAKEVGIAEGTIFRYFKNKRELILKVIMNSVDVIADGLITRRLTKIINENRDKNIREVLKLILIDRVNLIEENKDIFKVVINEIQYDEGLRQIVVNNIIMSAKNLILDFTQERSLKLKFRNDIDLFVALRSLIGMVMMYMFQKEVFPDLITMDKEKQIEEMTDIFLDGIIKREEM